MLADNTQRFGHAVGGCGRHSRHTDGGLRGQDVLSDNVSLNALVELIKAAVEFTNSSYGGGGAVGLGQLVVLVLKVAVSFLLEISLELMVGEPQL